MVAIILLLLLKSISLSLSLSLFFFFNTYFYGGDKEGEDDDEKNVTVFKNILKQIMDLFYISCQNNIMFNFLIQKKSNSKAVYRIYYYL